MRGTPTERKKRLIEGNLAYVRAIAAKVKEQLPREIEFDDLVAYGTQGLLEAADRFDGRHGASFTTFWFTLVMGVTIATVLSWFTVTLFVRLFTILLLTVVLLTMTV